MYGNFLPDISYVCLLTQSPPWIFVTSSHAIFLQIVQMTWWFDGLRVHSFSVALQTRVAVAKEFSGWEYIVDANISKESLRMTFELGQQPGVVTFLASWSAILYLTQPTVYLSSRNLQIVENARKSLLC